MAGRGNTVSRVWELVQPYARELGLSIWDIRFAKEGATWYLRIFIDKEGGVDINDCVDMTHAVNKPLDEADLIEQSYCLEVSSPGLERELTREEHFAAFLGAPVMVHTIRPIDGVRDFKGELHDYENGEITLLLPNGRELTVNKKEAASVRLDDFGGFES